MKKKLACLVGASLACGSTGVLAAGEGITFSGFVTAGATYADQRILDPASSTGTRAVSQDGNIENRVGFTNDSRIGIQLSARVNREVSITGQLLARGSEDNFNMKADWAFVTYRAADQLSIRGGKLKLTTFLVSDYIEVGYAYPWIRPPQEVYYANPITTISGVDALVRFNFGDYSLLAQPYFGNSRGEQALVPQEFVVSQPMCAGPDPSLALVLSPCPAGTLMYADFTADSLVGINVSFGSDLFTVRGGYLETLVSAPSFGVAEDKAKFASIGATVDWKGLVLYSEYFQREIEGLANGAFPNQKGAYATLGYRFGRFLPHVTYATLDDNDNPAMGGFPLKQTSATLGLRYELGTGAALKIEAQQVKPDCATGKPGEICRGLLIADPNSGPEGNNRLMVYSVAVDVVF